jgi:hypothetical protein
MRISWRHFRTDLLGIACLGVVATCLVFKWPAWAMVALGMALFCAISPRMKGPFKLRSGPLEARGALDFEEGRQKAIVKPEVNEAQKNPGTIDRPPPSSREPPED